MQNMFSSTTSIISKASGQQQAIRRYILGDSSCMWIFITDWHKPLIKMLTLLKKKKLYVDFLLLRELVPLIDYGCQHWKHLRVTHKNPYVVSLKESHLAAPDACPSRHHRLGLSSSSPLTGLLLCLQWACLGRFLECSLSAPCLWQIHTC